MKRAAIVFSSFCLGVLFWPTFHDLLSGGWGDVCLDLAGVGFNTVALLLAVAPASRRKEGR